MAQAALLEVAELSQLSMGPQMLLSIGIEYELTADRALGYKGHDWFGYRADGHKSSTAAKAAMAAIQMAQAESSFASMDGSKQAEAQSQFASKMQDSLYNMFALDIETTVAGAVQKVCADTSVSKEVRRERARGLVKLGKIFQMKLPSQEGGAPGAAPAAAPGSGAAASSAAAGGGGKSSAAAGPPSREVLMGMSVKELKAVMEAQGISSAGLLEKGEFVDAIMGASGAVPVS